MTRNKVFLGTLGCITIFSSNILAQDKSRPNVVLIVADDHGLDALGCYGNPVIKTPHIDALAKDGVRFSNAYCTSASSSASRAVLLTGKFGHSIAHYGHEHAFHHFRTFENEKSLPIYLEEAGYRTTRIGKYHVAPEQVYHFQNEIKVNDRSSVEMAEKCKSFITQDSKQPFFLYFCSSDPHRSDSSLNLQYQPNAFGNKDQSYPGVKEVVYNPNAVIVPPFLPDTPECRAELAQYYQSVSRLDQGVGRLIEILKQFEIYDNTLIIYISDNGIAFPGAKTTVYEPGIKLPCIIKAPKQKGTNRICDSFISWVDVTPTILDFTTIKVKERLFGRSFSDEIKNPKAEPNRKIYAAHTFHEITMYYPMRVVRDGKYKLIVNFAHELCYPSAADLWSSPTFQSIACLATKKSDLEKTDEFRDFNSVPNFRAISTSDLIFGKRKLKNYFYRPFIELYNLETDPDEIVNLADNTVYKDILNKMLADMIAFQKETNDPWAIKWEYE